MNSYDRPKVAPCVGERAFTMSYCFDFGRKHGILCFPLVKLTIPVGDDTTFGFKNDAMWWKIWYQLTSCRQLSPCIAFGPALKTLWFLHSGAQGRLFAIHQSLSSSKFCDVCCPSLFMHLPSRSRRRFCLKNDKSLFSPGKTDDSCIIHSYKTPLGGLQIGFVGHPCRSPNHSGQSHFGDIRLPWACIGDGMLSLRISMPMFSAIHGIHSFPLRKLTLSVGIDLTLVFKTRVIWGQHLYSVSSWRDIVPNLPI